MSISATSGTPAATDVSFTDRAMVVSLADGRTISVPIDWFPRLKNATIEQRLHWRLIGHGIGIAWDEIDEDISVSRLLHT
jgi:hypothetical protein